MLKLLIIFCVFFNCIFGLTSEDGLSYSTVNVITGSYCEQEIDIIPNSKSPIPVKRSYSVDTGWEFSCYGEKIAPPLSYKFSNSKEKLLENIDKEDGSFCRYEYCTHPTKKGIKLISQKTELQGKCLINEYYDKTSKHAGKVRRQLSSQGSSDESLVILYDFTYSEGKTIVLDALGNKTIYCYSCDDCLDAVISYINENGVETLYKKQKFYWNTPDNKAKRQLLSKTLENDQGKILVCYSYTYDDNGMPIAETVWGNISGENTKEIILSSNGTPVHNGCECYTKPLQPTEKQRQENKIDSNEGLNPSINYEFDIFGRPISITDSKGALTTVEYDHNGNIIHTMESDTEGQCQQTASFYDFSNRLIKKEHYDGKGNTTSISYKYDLCGRKIAETDTYGNTTLFQLDSLGRQIEIQHPFVSDEKGNAKAPIEKREYDVFDNVIASTNANGYTTKTQYNIRNQPIEIVYPSGSKEKFLYTIEGNIKKATAKNGTSALYNRDENGQLISIELVDENGSLIGYKELKGQRASDEKGIKHQKENNQEDQKPLQTFNNTTSVSYQNDLGQNVLQLVQVFGQGATVQTQTYDALGRIVLIEDKNPFGITIAKKQISYDFVGNKTKEIYTDYSGSNSNKTLLWEYNSNNQLTAVIETLDSYCRQTSYSYNCCDQLETITYPNGIVLYHKYGPCGHLSEIYSSDNKIHYSYFYDVHFNITKVIDHITGCEVIRKYDEKGKIIYEKLGENAPVEFSFGDSGNIESLTLPDSSKILYAYNDNTLKTVTKILPSQDVAYSHDFKAYDEHGHILESSLIGSCGYQKIVYDELGKVVSIKTRYWSEELEREKQKTVRAVKDAIGAKTTEFSYDEQGQIVSEVSKENSDSYTYNFQKQRTSKNGVEWIYNEEGQLISTGKSFFTWDCNGNCTSKIQNHQTVEYVYDAFDRLCQVTKGSTVWRYSYDGFHRRIQKQRFIKNFENNSLEPKEKYTFIYQDNCEIGCLDEKGAIIELRVLGNTKTADIGSAVAIELNGKPYAPIHDKNGSVCCLIDTNEKTVAETYRYSAFGDVEIYNKEGELKQASEINNPWLFTSKRKDPESNLYYYGLRYYSPEMAQWMTLDPMGFVDGPNRYLFVQNNPLELKDLFGLYSISEAWNDTVNFMTPIYQAFNSFLETIRNHVSIETYLYPHIDSISKENLGAGLIRFIGFCSELPEVGLYGKKEYSDKVRITLVNGILNTRPDFMQSVQMVSETHGDINIHYIFRPTLGWSWDMMKSFLVKCGYISQQAEHIAATWKKLINEMGGVGCGGSIIHYAHSIGAADTYAARDLLTPLEQKMVNVVTFGSPTIIPNEGFQSVINYISVRDGVPLLDPVNRLLAALRGDVHVVAIGNYIGIPFIDHFFSASDTYGSIVRWLGDEFIKNYGS